MSTDIDFMRGQVRQSFKCGDWRVLIKNQDLTALLDELDATKARAEKAEAERDVAQIAAAELDELFNDLADFLDLPTGVLRSDILDAVRKLKEAQG